MTLITQGLSEKILFLKGDLQITPTTEPKTTNFSIE